MMAVQDDEEERLRAVTVQNAQALLLVRQLSEEALRKQSEWLRVTLASIGDAVISTDAEGQVTFMNGIAEALTGWPQAEAVGRPLPDVFHIVNERTRQPVDNPALRALREGRIVGLANHTILIARDGTEKPIDDSAAPMRDKGGETLGAVLVFRDVTERKMAEVIQARLAAIVESSEDAIISKTLDGVIRSWNAGAERLFGYTAEEAIGKSITLIIPPERQEEERMILAQLRRGERIQHFETVRLTRDGRRIDISLSVSPLRNEEGLVIGASKVARDITGRRRAEAERERLAETLRVAMAAADLGTWEWDVVTDELTLSPRAAEIYGVNSVGSHRREQLRDQLHPDHRDRARHEATRAVAERIDYDIEYPLVSGRWVSARGRGVYDAAGALTRMLGVVQDVTARKVSEATLRASEERYRALVTATSDVVYRMSADWTVMQPLDGRDFFTSSAEPRRDWMLTNLPAHEHPRVQEAIDRAIDSKQAFELEHQIIRADGTLGWTFSRAVPILDAGGNIVDWFGAARDVTAQKQAQEELARVTAESERRRRLYETILSSTPDFVYVFSLDHRVLYANDSLLTMWGRCWDDTVGKTFLEVGYEPWHAEMHCREIDQVRTTKRPIRGEIPFHGTYGHRIYDYIFVPVLGADGEVEAVAGTTRDVTEIREADRRKDEFIALLAHELRNPLAPLRNGLQVMRLASGDAEAVDQARSMMERQLGHMVRLIDDLLDISRISQNKMELRRSRVLLADVVTSAVETAGPMIEEAGHELMVSLPARPVLLDADLTRLAQVFSNLLANSAKYTERGGRIWIAAERQGREVVASVKDTGIGIPAEFLPRIFDMFAQVDRSLERSAGGLGIGLALVKGLVEMHGGTVAVQSEGQGMGSTFTVRLPVLDATPEPSQAPPPEHRRSTGGPKRRILVVDDNHDSARSMARLLTLMGNETRAAHDGIEALAVAEEFRPEVILMDMGMPRLNGYEATRRIREQDWGRSTLIIALTGWGQEGDRLLSREAGCDAHLVKPVDFSDLETLLAELPGAEGPEHARRSV